MRARSAPGLPEQTLKNWLTQGRQEADTEHADFTAAVGDLNLGGPTIDVSTMTAAMTASA